MKYVIGTWMWFGLVLFGISKISGSPNPIAAWFIMTALAGPPLLWMLWMDDKENQDA